MLRRLFRSLSPQPTQSAKAFEARDVFSAGLFPVCPATHDLGIRRLFDLATLLLLLDCRPGDRVLDLGAGPGFSSETLARLGYDVIALDPDAGALQHNRRRLTFDRTRIEGTLQVTQGVAERLPFRDEVFDGVLGMNVLHHVPDLRGVLAELGRVLRPGCRAVFVEPGVDHLKAEETERARREHGEDDRAFDVIAFLREARTLSFKQAMLTATLQPPLRLLPVEEIDLYLSGQHPRSFLTPTGVIDELHRHHAYALLERDGQRPKTSRHPGMLRCELRIEGGPPTIRAGGVMSVGVSIVNTGDTIWNARPSRLGGFVTLGCKLLTSEGRLQSDKLGRTFFARDVHPGDAVQVTATVAIPGDTPPGEYRLSFDLVDELICWFADVSAVPAIDRPLQVLNT